MDAPAIEIYAREQCPDHGSHGCTGDCPSCGLRRDNIRYALLLTEEAARDLEHDPDPE